jgi:hypothetical protein
MPYSRKVMRTSLWILVASAVALFGAASAVSQTITVLHRFTGGGYGSEPETGLAIDRAGNLYGTTFYGANQECLSMDAAGNLYGRARLAGLQNVGSVFELTRDAQNWTGYSCTASATLGLTVPTLTPTL